MTKLLTQKGALWEVAIRPPLGMHRPHLNSKLRTLQGVACCPCTPCMYLWPVTLQLATEVTNQEQPQCTRPTAALPSPRGPCLGYSSSLVAR